jgi:hypothetical protein
VCVCACACVDCVLVWFVVGGFDVVGSCLAAEKVGKGKRKPRQGNLRARIYVLQSIKVGQERYDTVPEIR